MVRRERGMPFITSSPSMPYDRKILALAFLAPNIQRGILTGKQPPMLNLERLTRLSLPLDWHEQRKMLGWPQHGETCYAE
jgi:site-specific DNA recombinase